MRRAYGILLLPVRETMAGLIDPFLVKRDAPVSAIILPVAAAIAVTWFVTVPVHELLHAAGCILSGGTVKELTIRPLYGGALFERFIPFVRSGGTYAGQLSDFETGGSDLRYLITDLFPYILTVLFGLPLLALAARSGNAVLHGIGIVQTLLPAVSVAGDYYEMGSILATRIAGYSPVSAGAELVRGDDLALVVERVSASDLPGGMLLVGFGLLIALMLIWTTWGCSLACSRIIVRKPLEKEIAGG